MLPRRRELLVMMGIVSLTWVILNMLHSATLDPGEPEHGGPRVVRVKPNPFVHKKLRLAYLCIPHQSILPLKGYGGTESSCEAELEGLTKLQEDGCLDFFAVIPTRGPHNNTYPFPIIEVGKVGMENPTFIQLFVEELHKMPRDEWPHLVWCQEEVCPNTIREMGIDLPVLATIHHGYCNNAIDHGPSVLLRFPSQHTAEQCVQNGRPWLADRGFALGEAFKDSEYQFNDREGEYFLWVGGCYWDGQKGLPLFQDLARELPQHKFVVYCSGEPPVADRLREFQQQQPNFEFRGELMRGKEHHEAFSRAKAFFFWTHAWGETFGRVIIEAFSKGTPVLASGHAANPELVTPGTGLVASSEDELKNAFDLTFDRRAAYERSLSFRSKVIVQGLFLKSRKWMTMLEEFDVYTNPMCLSSADDHPLGV